MRSIKRLAIYAAIGVAAAASVPFSGTAQALQPVAANCAGAGTWDITPLTAGGAQYVMREGAGLCIQGAPRNGDWSVQELRGNGRATTYTCTGSGGVVGGLKLTVNVHYHNNKTDVDSHVQEIWTQILPVDAISDTNMNITPGNTQATIATRVFGTCPPGGSPSAKIIWSDKNMV
jgi:hypothetical protein